MEQRFLLIFDIGATSADYAVESEMEHLVRQFGFGAAGIDKTFVAACLQMANSLHGTLWNITVLSFGEKGAVNVKK